MSDIYAVTLRTEVLREFAASIGASYSRYFIKHSIDWKDETNPLVANSWELAAAKDKMLRCDTLEELQPFENRLKEMRDIIKGLEDVDKCEEKSLRVTLTASLQTR
jgi:hypothetical protein